MTDHTIEALFDERRVFPPSPEFVARASISTTQIYDDAESNPEQYWARYADELVWRKPYDEICDWSGAPFA